ncbi:hypothetical protein [Saccharothrix sp. HUAS TT1]|uniref:hypothetical protein n=1 Tax=unclassified Saccharothrix TaxID=2593673 RepID=UPI00345BCF40
MSRALRQTITAGALALGLLGGAAGTAQALTPIGTSSPSNTAANTAMAHVVVVGSYTYDRCHYLGKQYLQQGAYHYSCTHEGGTYGWKLRAYYD